MVADKMCGLCLEFGPTGALQVPLNQGVSETCDVKCDNGEPGCKFLVTSVEDRRGGRGGKRPFKLFARIGRWTIRVEKE